MGSIENYAPTALERFEENWDDATLRIWDTRTRVASRLADDRWAKLQAELATRSDLEETFSELVGEEREAARVERIRRGCDR